MIVTILLLGHLQFAQDVGSDRQTLLGLGISALGLTKFYSSQSVLQQEP